MMSQIESIRSTHWTKTNNLWAEKVNGDYYFKFFFSDNLLDEVEILDWLKRNRYKPVELHWIMYSVLSVALAFLLYSLFILYGLKEKEVEVKKED